MSLKESIVQYTTQANALLTVLTGLIIGILTHLIPSMDQYITLIFLALIWAEAYTFRLVEKRMDKTESKSTVPEDTMLMYQNFMVELLDWLRQYQKPIAEPKVEQPKA